MLRSTLLRSRLVTQKNTQNTNFTKHRMNHHKKMADLPWSPLQSDYSPLIEAGWVKRGPSNLMEGLSRFLQRFPDVRFSKILIERN